MKFEIPISFFVDARYPENIMISVTKDELKACYIVELSLKTPFVTKAQKEAYKCVRRYPT
jgi:hypothetical protein